MLIPKTRVIHYKTLTVWCYNIAATFVLNIAVVKIFFFDDRVSNDDILDRFFKTSQPTVVKTNSSNGSVASSFEVNRAPALLERANFLKSTFYGRRSYRHLRFFYVNHSDSFHFDKSYSVNRRIINGRNYDNVEEMQTDAGSCLRLGQQLVCVCGYQCLSS